MSSREFTTLLRNFLNQLPEDSIIGDWIFKGIDTKTAFGTVGGAWDATKYNGYVFQGKQRKYLLRLPFDSSYVIFEMFHTTNQLVNYLLKPDNYKVSNDTVTITETFDMTVKVRISRKEVKSAMVQAGFSNDGVIMSFKIAEFDATQTIEKLLRWATIREDAKKIIKDARRKVGEPTPIADADLDEIKPNGVILDEINTHNIILYGPPGTGKTYHTIDLAVSLTEGTMSNDKDHATNKLAFNELKKSGQIEFITFHQNYSYEDFMIGLRPRTDEGDALTFKKHEGIFYQLCKRAEENYLSFKEVNSELKHYVLIIDEINRANISRVFGELITLLEDDKRIGKQHELRITLPNGERDFGIPPNLHVVGTMNTADKSISLVDIALRRRFEFIGKYPNYEPQDDCGYTEDKAHLLRKLNENIYTEKKTADFLIGHAYFMKNEPIEMTIKNKVIPLLMEYFNNRTNEVKKIFHGTNWTIEYNTGSYGWDIITPKTGEA